MSVLRMFYNYPIPPLFHESKRNGRLVGETKEWTSLSVSRVCEKWPMLKVGRRCSQREEGKRLKEGKNSFGEPVLFGPRRRLSTGLVLTSRPRGQRYSPHLTRTCSSLLSPAPSFRRHPSGACLVGLKGQLDGDRRAAPPATVLLFV